MIQIHVRQICLIMLAVSIPLLALAAASRSAEVIYAVAATTIIQMVAIAFAAVVMAGRKKLPSKSPLNQPRARTSEAAISSCIFNTSLKSRS